MNPISSAATPDQAALLAQLEALQRSQTELAHLRYSDACLARFSDLMRWQNDANLQAWALRILDALSVEFQALQIALYQLEAESEELVYVGGFATHPKGTEQRVPMGSGLVGQVAISRRALYLSHESGIDTHTHSSLARLQLRGIALLPLLANEQLQGVLELATLDPLAPEQQRLLESLAGVLAANLGSIAGQARLQHLLAEAQQQSNRLQAQEEELRQNLEELEATQEEMRRVQEAMQQTNREFHNQMQALDRSTAVVELSLEGTVLRANPQFLAISGYRAEQLVGQPHQRIVPAAMATSQAYTDFWAALRRGEFQRGEFERLRPDGSSFWIQGSYNPVMGANGKPEKVVKFCLDITAQKQQEAQLKQAFEELQASEEEIRQNSEELQAQHEEMRRLQLELQGQISALNHAAIVSEADVRGDILFANDEFVRLSQYSREELMGRNHRIVKGGNQPQAIFVELWATIRTGRVWRGELQNKAKDGSYYWVAATITPVVAPDGKPLKYIGVRFDITAQKRQEEQLTQAYEEMQASEEELRQNAEELQAQHEEMRRVQQELESTSRHLHQQLHAIDRSTAVVELSLDGTVLAANDQFLAISGYSQAQLVGQAHRSIVPAAYAASPAYTAFWAALRRGEFQRGEFERLRPDGTSFWIQGSYNPVLGADGTPEKVVKFCFEITAQKQQEHELKQAFEELQASEEELRQNTEEMQAQHEELQRAQVELSVTSRRLLNQLEAIDRSTCVVELSLDGTVRHANAQFLRISGYSQADLVGQPHRSLVPPGYAGSEAYRFFWEALRRGEFQQGEFERLRADGTSFWIAGSYNPVLGVDGKLEKILKFCVDITAQKQQQAQYRQAIEELQAAEEEVRQNAEELTAQHEEMRRLQLELQGQIGALHNAAIVSEADIRGNILSANDEFVRLSKYTREELLGRNHRIVKGGNQPQHLFVDLWNTISQGQIWRGELQNKAKDGSYYWVAATITPVLGRDGRPVKYIGVRFDITALKEAEQQLLQRPNHKPSDLDTATSDPAAATPDLALPDALHALAKASRSRVKR